MNYTKEFFAENGHKSVKARMKKYTPEQRREFALKAWVNRRANLKNKKVDK